MSARAAPLSREPTHDERAFVEAEVDAVLEGYRALLSEEELGWMREQLLTQVGETPALAQLVSAAAPRSVDQSGEVSRAPKR